MSGVLDQFRNCELGSAMRCVKYLCAILAPVFLFGCSKPPTRVEKGTAEQVLHMGNLSEPTDLDPHVVTSLQTFNIISSLFEGLMGHDPEDATPVYALAESHEVSNDGKTYTFKLRENARWSNGDPVTAQDFVRTYQRILSPGIASEYSYLHHVVENAEAYANGRIEDFSEVGYKALDDHTLEFRLNAPTPYFLALLSHHSFYPVHLPTIERFGGAEKRGTDWTRPENFVGNGPFNLKEWQVNDHITVVKSDTYWDRDTVRLSAINFYPIESADTEERAFRSGQLHITSTIPTSKIESYRQNQPELLHISPFFATYFMRFNTEKEPLNDPRVRRALTLVVDRAGIIRTILKSGQQPAYNLTPPNIPGYVMEPQFSEDIELAQRLLAEAGYPNGDGFPKIEYLYNTNEGHKLIAEALQQMWKEHLGINVTLVNQEAKVYIATMGQGDYDIGRYAWVGDYLDPSSFLEVMTSASGNNATGWSNEAYDGLLAQAGREANPEKRMELFREAEEILMREMPIGPLYFYTRNNLRLPTVKGWHSNLLDIHPYKYVWLDSEAAGP